MVPRLANVSYKERPEAMDLPSLACRRLRGMQLRCIYIWRASTKLTHQVCWH